MTEKERKIEDILKDLEMRSNAAIRTLKSTSPYKSNAEKQLRDIIYLANQIQIILDFE